MPELPANIACAPCGGSLLGVDLDGDCPACGRAVSDTLDTAAIDPATMTIASDVACLGCGYNLRTLRIDKVCPECARRISDSLEPIDLRLADKAWLRRVREGLTLLLVALGGYALEMVLVMIIVTVAFSTASSSAFNTTSGWIIVVSVILGVLGVGGLLIITAIELKPRGRPSSNFPHLAARWALLIFFVTLTMSWVIPKTGFRIGPLHAALSGISSASAALAIIFVLICLRRLAIRERGTGLRRLTTTLIWLIGIGGLWQGAMQVCFVLIMPQVQAMTMPIPANVGPGAISPGPQGNVSASNASKSLADGSETSPAGVVTSSVVTVSVPTSGSAVALSAGPVAPAALPRWMMLIGFLSCGAGLLMVIVFVVGVVAIVLYRGMLTAALRSVASEPVQPLE